MFLNKRILITGAGGAIGKALTSYLISNTSYNITLNYFTELDIPQNLNRKDKRIKIVVGNIIDNKVCESMFKDTDVVIHLASTVNPKGYTGDWNEAFKFGAASTFVILDYIKTLKHNIHIIFPSSGGTVYSANQRTPFKETDETLGVSPYGIQKVMFENYLRLLVMQNKHVTCNILRISNPYALSLNNERKQGFIDTVIHNIVQNEKISIWSPMDTIRDYIHIDDLCEAFLASVKYKDGFQIINIGSGYGTSLEEVINIISDNLKRKISYEKFEPINYYYPAYSVLNINKAENLLNWKPKISLEEGIKKIIENLC